MNIRFSFAMSILIVLLVVAFGAQSAQAQLEKPGVLPKSKVVDKPSSSAKPLTPARGCPAGEILDCNDNCCPDYWVGDGYCDDGTYSHNGIPIYLNCEEFDCDGGDCVCGDGTGACCVNGMCVEGNFPDECQSDGGTFQGEGTTCDSVDCSSPCAAGEIEDCFGNCCPDYWVGDGFCDDGAYEWNGIAIYLNCDQFNCDAGDCVCGDATGACCYGPNPEGLICGDNVSEADCESTWDGTYQGDGTDCMSVDCNAPTTGACCYGPNPGGLICGDNVSEADCEATWDGTYQGNGTECMSVDCNAPTTGACCLADGLCQDALTGMQCKEFGGVYQGNGVLCSAVECTGPVCPTGEIEDCFGNCCPDFWVGDGYCDDGAYEWNGIAIYLNCEEFNCDGGDCICGGTGAGSCCIDDVCHDDYESEKCATAGGVYQGDGSTCDIVDCDAPCAAGWTLDCVGTCFPDYVYEAWLGDTYCDDGSYAPSDYGCEECPLGVGIFLNCEEFNCDEGDCGTPPDCGGPPAQVGACCIGILTCYDDTSLEDCQTEGGTYQGDGTTCDSVDCSAPCLAGEIEDCFGNCCPDYWVGDGYCDNGAYEWNGIAIYLNCDQFNCDAGDCDPSECEGGGGTGACCVDDMCYDDYTVEQCDDDGGVHQGVGTTCKTVDCSSPCGLDEIEDCFGNCCPANWVGDGYCDNGAYEYNGIAIYLNCAQFDCDGGDCDPSECEDPGDFGACCHGNGLCMDNVTDEDCSAVEGIFFPDLECDSADIDCEPCLGDANGDGHVNITDLLGVIGDWNCDTDVEECTHDINNDGVVNVTDLLDLIGNWGPCDEV